MPMSDRKVSDLFTIADAIKTAGSKWMQLMMEVPYKTEIMEIAMPSVAPSAPEKQKKPF